MIWADCERRGGPHDMGFPEHIGCGRLEVKELRVLDTNCRY